MRPKISVIMAAYNVERFIDEAIQSVLSQEGVSFELLIGDDASTDGTWQRVGNYLKDPRIRVKRFDRHRGPWAVWNDLIRCASGSHLSFCDADDVMLPGNLRAAHQLLEEDLSAGATFVPLRFMDREGNHVLRYPSISVCDPTRNWDLLKMGGSQVGAMIRAGLMRKVGGYREHLLHIDAYDLFLRLSEIARILMVPGGPLYLYRISRHRQDQRRMTKRLRLQAVGDAIRRRYGYRVPW